MERSKTAILSTVINFELYAKSSLLFPDEVQKYVIDGRSGMYGIESLCYMMKKLGNKDIDWLIMADEDVLFQDRDAVFNLIVKMEQEGIMFAGVRDGGVIKHRNNCPFVINTFFSILNFKELKRIWNRQEMLANQYVHEDEFKDEISQLPYPYNSKSLYEPYYCFYFWLRRLGKKALFLDAEMPFAGDDITNTVLDTEGKRILYHTWYARSYGKSEKHTSRIDSVFELIDKEHKNISQPVVFKDTTFALRKYVNKQLRRIKNKIGNNG